MSLTKPTGAPGVAADQVVTSLPDLTGVSLDQARSLDTPALSEAVQRVLTEADTGIGQHLSFQTDKDAAA